MKNLNKILTFAIVLITLSSCSTDDDATLPQSLGEDSTEFNINYGELITYFNENSVSNELTFEDTEFIIQGYVVSSDKEKNFYKEVVIQEYTTTNAPGLKISINSKNINDTFNFSRKLWVKLDGLTMIKDNSEFIIGFKDSSGNFSGINEDKKFNYIVRSVKKNTISVSGRILNIEDITSNSINTLVKINNLQFADNELDKSFAAQPTDEYDAERTLINCETGESIILSTSVNSNFAFNPIYSEQGTITGVLTRDYFDEHYILKINSLDDIDFINERCN